MSMKTMMWWALFAATGTVASVDECKSSIGCFSVQLKGTGKGTRLQTMEEQQGVNHGVDADYKDENHALFARISDMEGDLYVKVTENQHLAKADGTGGYCVFDMGAHGAEPYLKLKRQAGLRCDFARAQNSPMTTSYTITTTLTTDADCEDLKCPEPPQPQLWPPQLQQLSTLEDCAADCTAVCRKSFHDGDDDQTSFRSCSLGCKLPNAGKARADDVDEYCHTLTLPSVDFAACKKGTSELQKCDAAGSMTLATSSTATSSAVSPAALNEVVSGCTLDACHKWASFCDDWDDQQAECYAACEVRCTKEGLCHSDPGPFADSDTGCKAKATGAGEAAGYLAVVDASMTCEDCKARQAKGENIACELSCGEENVADELKTPIPECKSSTGCFFVELKSSGRLDTARVARGVNYGVDADYTEAHHALFADIWDDDGDLYVKVSEKADGTGGYCIFDIGAQISAYAVLKKQAGLRCDFAIAGDAASSSSSKTVLYTLTTEATKDADCDGEATCPKIPQPHAPTAPEVAQEVMIIAV